MIVKLLLDNVKICLVKTPGNPMFTSYMYELLNPSNAKATFIHSTMTQRFLKTIQTL